MIVNISADNAMKNIDLKRKLVSVVGDAVGENTLYSAIEMGISGEPLTDYMKEDSNNGIVTRDISSVAFSFDRRRASKLYRDASGWHYEETQDATSKSWVGVFEEEEGYGYKKVSTKGTLSIPSLQCIRIMSSDDTYIFRNTITESSEQDADIVNLLGVNFFRYSEILPLSLWMRLVATMNKLVGYTAFTLKQESGTMVLEFMQNDECKYSANSIKILYTILGMCMTPVPKSSSKTVKKIVLWKIAKGDELAYKVLGAISELPDIAYLIFSHDSEQMRSAVPQGSQVVSF